ncbi:lectin-like [Salvia hispanica]|uniref:lectin-like n=1 Tax=Salvia hispanica TaxID=49212 RepID=UPI0020091068|nr:lectin-like [Salvia hispanica]XP_047942353.1 lectin-like [Salvia hispanica]
MAKFLQTLIPLFLVLVLANTARSQSVTQSFNYTFNDGVKPATLTYQGNTHIRADSTYLQLTATRPDGEAVLNNVGRAMHSVPFTFGDMPGWSDADFTTTVKFFIRPNTGATAAAEGLAFFIAPVGSQIPSASFGENLGIYEYIGYTPNLFAVEFDIYPNPEVDPEGPHVGINFESIRSDTATIIPEGLVGEEVTADISYVAATKTITVVVVTAGGRRTEVSKVYDLKSLLQARVQVGLSASTGVFVARHEVISWDFTITRTAAAAARIRKVA